MSGIKRSWESSAGTPFIRLTGRSDAEFDITAMVDLVFMMNIYFLVTFVTVALSQMDLPPAVHCEPLDAETAVTVCLENGGYALPARLWLAPVPEGDPVVDVEQQERQLDGLCSQAVADGKEVLVIKAERHVRLSEVFRVARAGTGHGLKLYFAVLEVEGER